MVLRKRIVARLGARRPLAQPLVTRATCHRSRAAGACLLALLLMSPGRSLSDPGATPAARGPGPAAAALAVSVSETPDAVRLRIQASGDIEPGSVEVRFAGRKAVVLARLPTLVLEEGASADYDAEDALVMTLRKQAAAQAAAPPGDPEAAAR
jgi:hypothetical protein